jgi:hypothetical protein
MERRLRTPFVKFAYSGEDIGCIMASNIVVDDHLSMVIGRRVMAMACDGIIPWHHTLSFLACSVLKAPEKLVHVASS